VHECVVRVVAVYRDFEERLRYSTGILKKNQRNQNKELADEVKEDEEVLDWDKFQMITSTLGGNCSKTPTHILVHPSSVPVF
jgi:hypothetical protein